MPGTLTTLPDLARSFAKMKLQDLLAAAPGYGMFADSVRASAIPHRDECIKMVSDQIKDNRDLTIDQVGEQAVLIIEKYEL